MASSTRKEVELALSITTVNADSIKALQQDVARLAKEGGDAAPEFTRLALELDKLSHQAAALSTLEALGADIAKLGDAQTQAAAKSEQLGAQLGALKAVTDAAATSERSAKTALDDKKRAVQEAGDALKTLKANTAQADRQNADYLDNLRALIARQIDLRGEVRTLAVEYGSAQAATRAAKTEQAALASVYATAATETRRAASELKGAADAADAAKEKLHAAGAASEDLAGAQAHVATSLSGTRQALQQTLEAEGAAAAARRVQAQEMERQALREQAIRSEQRAQAKDEADGIIRDFERMKQAERDAAATARAHGEALQQALGVVGVRSAQQIRDEITRVGAAFELLRTSGTLSAAELGNANAQAAGKVNALERELRGVTGQLTLADKAAGLFKGSMGQFAAGNLIAMGVSALASKVMELGSSFVTVNVQAESLRRGLNAVYQSTDVASAQFDLLRNIATQAGVAVGDISPAFLKYAAATKAANIPLAQANEMFSALVLAGTTLGLSSEKVSLSLDAMGQMASKGVVSMEELRQQLGDSLPGAFSVMARGLGITEAQLGKLVESGNLLARDAIPAMTRGLQGLAGTSDGLQPTWERLKGAFTQIAQGMGDAGVTAVLTGALKLLGGTAAAAALGMSVLVEALFTTGRAVVAFYGSLKGDAKAWEWFNTETDKTVDRLAGQARAFNAMLDPSAQAQNAVTQFAGATGQAATALAALEQATAATAKAAGATGQQWVAASVILSEQIKKGEAAIQVADKHTTAVQEQGRAAQELARLTGVETQALDASTRATQNNLAAEESKLTTQRADLAILTQQLAKQKELAAADKEGSADRLKAITETQKLVDLRAVEVERTAATVQKLHELTAAHQLAAAAYQDNSAKVQELRDNITQLQQHLRELETLNLNGKRTDAEVAAARTEVAKATGLLNDALADNITKLQAKATADRAAADVTSIKLGAQKAEQAALEASARAVGDYGQVLQAVIAQKQIDIKIIEARVALMRVEADSTIAVAKAELTLLNAKGEVATVRRAELDATLKIAEARKAEAQALGKSTDAIQQQINALREGRTHLDGFTTSTNSARQATDGLTGSVLREIEALEKKNAAQEKVLSAQEKELNLQERQIALEMKKKGLTKDGWAADANGNPVSEFLPGKGYVYEQAKTAGLDERTALALENQYMDEQGNPTGYQQDPAKLAQGKGWAVQVAEAIAGTKLKNAQQANAGNQQTNPNAVQQGSGRTYTVNVNIGGQNTPVNVASDADAQALIAVLQRAKMTA